MSVYNRVEDMAPANTQRNTEKPIEDDDDWDTDPDFVSDDTRSKRITLLTSISSSLFLSSPTISLRRSNDGAV